MKLTRRDFLSTTAIATVAAALPFSAQAKTVAYTAKTLDSLLASGETFMMGIHAKWCSTCDRQNRVIDALREQGEPYKSMTILNVDWDEHRKSPLIAKYNVPRRSTLIMFKNGKEVGRIVAGTSSSKIKGLIDKGFQTS